MVCFLGLAWIEWIAILVFSSSAGCLESCRWVRHHIQQSQSIESDIFILDTGHRNTVSCSVFYEPDNLLKRQALGIHGSRSLESHGRRRPQRSKFWYVMVVLWYLWGLGSSGGSDIHLERAKYGPGTFTSTSRSSAGVQQLIVAYNQFSARVWKVLSAVLQDEIVGHEYWIIQLNSLCCRTKRCNRCCESTVK